MIDASTQRSEPPAPRVAVLAVADVGLTYGSTVALASANVTVESGQVVAVVGSSGSGKTSLLQCMATLTRPTRGSVRLRDRDLTNARNAELAAIRRHNFGFVFQNAELVPELSVAENVELPLNLLGVKHGAARQRVRETLDALDIGELASRRPDEISGGQAQRAAVARAIVHRPSVVFADEPTGALDTSNGDVVLARLIELAREAGSAVVIVTHDEKVAAAADRMIVMRDGVCSDVDRT